MKTIDLTDAKVTAKFDLTRNAFVHTFFYIKGKDGVFGAVAMVWRDQGRWHAQTQAWAMGETCMDIHESTEAPDECMECAESKVDELRGRLEFLAAGTGAGLTEITVKGSPEQMAELASSGTAGRFAMFKPEELGNVGGQVN